MAGNVGDILRMVLRTVLRSMDGTTGKSRRMVLRSMDGNVGNVSVDDVFLRRSMVGTVGKVVVDRRCRFQFKMWVGCGRGERPVGEVEIQTARSPPRKTKPVRRSPPRKTKPVRRNPPRKVCAGPIESDGSAKVWWLGTRRTPAASVSISDSSRSSVVYLGACAFLV